MRYRSMAGIMFALGASLALNPEPNAAGSAGEPAIVFPEDHWREREPSALGLDGGSSTSWPRCWAVRLRHQGRLGGQDLGFAVAAGQLGILVEARTEHAAVLRHRRGQARGSRRAGRRPGLEAGREGPGDDLRPPGEHDQRLRPARASGRRRGPTTTTPSSSTRRRCSTASSTAIPTRWRPTCFAPLGSKTASSSIPIGGGS